MDNTTLVAMAKDLQLANEYSAVAGCFDQGIVTEYAKMANENPILRSIELFGKTEVKLLQGVVSTILPNGKDLADVKTIISASATAGGLTEMVATLPLPSEAQKVQAGAAAVYQPLVNWIEQLPTVIK